MIALLPGGASTAFDGRQERAAAPQALATAGTAAAEPRPALERRTPPRSRPQKRRLLRAEIGGGAPAGFLGATLGYRAYPPLVLEYSVGWALNVWQNAFMARLETHRAPAAMTFGLGASIGCCPRRHDTGPNAYFWGHAEVGFVYAWANGASLLAGIGPTILIARVPPFEPGEAGCGSFCEPSLPLWALGIYKTRLPVSPFLRVGIGAAF